MANLTINNELNGIELTFENIPTEDTRNNLKQAGFRWHKVKKLWYAKMTDERMTFAKSIAELKETPTERKPKEAKKNKYGVKVGDFFSASWGYDQTNVDYFQVIALVGETSVRVREVYPEYTTTDRGFMSEDRTYKLDRSKILPPAPNSVFIKDQENGDIKRLKSYRQDGTRPQFTLDSFANAYLVSGDTETNYVSWYA